MTEDGLITVKFVAKGHLLKDMSPWRRQLPDAQPQWGNCRFLLDPDAREYDWLVAYDDLPPESAAAQRSKVRLRTEPLACPREHTLLITAEPSTIKVFSRDFLGQFGTVLTSQEPWAVPHPNVVFTQPALRWYYGVPFDLQRGRMICYDELVTRIPLDKQHKLSTVTSSKRMGYTTHSLRYDFVRKLEQAIPDFDLYGRGIREINDKAEALDSYRYHLAIENYIGLHHWTEKLADAFLGCTLPLYYGAPNAADYFPPESFIAVDITDFDATVDRIRQAIANNEYEQRLPQILEARRCVLEEYNIFAVIAREVTRQHDPDRTTQADEVILSRHALRRSSIGHYARELHDRANVRIQRHKKKPDRGWNRTT
jgi:hypothetical protein